MRLLTFFLFGLVAAVLTGCAGYHLGPANGVTAGSQTVEVFPFNNQTLQPRLGEALTQALRERFQTDGTFHLATREPGDMVVTGTISNYERAGLGYLSTDTDTPLNYRLTVTAHVTVRDRVSGKLILDKDVKGHAIAPIGSNLVSAERQAMPQLGADLAQNIVELLAEGAW